MKEKYVDTIRILKERFESNMIRHSDLRWEAIERKIISKNKVLEALYNMEITGGEPDIIFYDIPKDHYSFVDCSIQTPSGRRALCYDKEALDNRKKNKPKTSAIDMAKELGIEILSEMEYRSLQQVVSVDTKTSSWVKTPANIRMLGGAIFCDNRYGTVFTYHNGADSYYSSRGFRGILNF